MAVFFTKCAPIATKGKVVGDGADTSPWGKMMAVRSRSGEKANRPRAAVRDTTDAVEAEAEVVVVVVLLTVGAFTKTLMAAAVAAVAVAEVVLLAELAVEGEVEAGEVVGEEVVLIGLHRV